LEFTWIRSLGFFFTFSPAFWLGEVIWAIGWSMIVLSALVYLPPRVVGWIGVAIVALHNLTDNIHPNAFGKAAWLWTLLHERGMLQPFPGVFFLSQYPLIPWIGILAAGYGFGSLFSLDATQRRKILVRLGIGLTLAFVVLRVLNVYGDPSKWAAQKNASLTLCSFLNCTKYPPSLLYTLMTLGPAILLLGVVSDRPSKMWRPFVTFGRVPLFYFLLHLPLLHGMAVLYSYFWFGKAKWLFTDPITGSGIPGLVPAGYGVPLGVVYLIWIMAVVMLYPLCKWFADVKRRRNEAWLSYF
jgi:uncharacterized membrane protein